MIELISAIAQMQIEHLEPLDTEDDILAGAVNMTNLIVIADSINFPN